MKIFSFSHWKKLFRVLNKVEKVTVVVFSIAFLFSLLFLLNNFYLNHTQIVPNHGGSYTEGLVGQPRFINPVYSETNDVDRDLTELIFSGLMKHENGTLKKDLAKEYNISEDGKTYQFQLRDDIFWHDGEKLTAEDVVFTIKTIQGSEYKSPQRATWMGVYIEKISEREVRFELNSPYGAFLENTTVKIIPEHIWGNISPENFTLSFYNLQPIGSGPYKFKEIKQSEEGFIESLSLESNENYHKGEPFISRISFLFFGTEESLVRSFQKREIEGMSMTSSIKHPSQNSYNSYSYSLPRYFAIFFNNQEGLLNQKEIRQALTYSVDKNILLEKMDFLGNEASSPILPDFFEYEKPENIPKFDLEKAKEILDEAGFEEGDIREKTIEKQPAFQFTSNLRVGSQGTEVRELQKCLPEEVYLDQEVTGYFGEKTKLGVINFQEKYREEILDPSGMDQAPGHVGPGTRDKLNELCFPELKEVSSLDFSLKTVNQEQLIKVAEFLKEQWKKIGVNVEITASNISDLRPDIKERNYDLLLFGQALGTIPDPFPFWHSSQRDDPGLNLARYENNEVDNLLEEAREISGEEERKKKFEKFQNILIKDYPAIFLYTPNYLHVVSEKVMGINGEKLINPAKRFSNIENWYIETKRKWK